MSSFDCAWKVFSASYNWLSEFFSRWAWHSQASAALNTKQDTTNLIDSKEMPLDLTEDGSIAQDELVRRQQHVRLDLLAFPRLCKDLMLANGLA